MKSHIAALTILSIPVAACADEACRHYSAKYYDEALSNQLSKNGIPHTVHPEKGICVSVGQEPGLEAASRQVDTYFHQVARVLKDECEERALVAWAEKEHLRFDVASARNSDGRPGGRMFLLRSFSREEASANQDKLWNKAPKHVSCASEGK